MVFTKLLQLQEKCRKQNKKNKKQKTKKKQPLLIAFVDLTKAFNTVSRKSLDKVFEKNGCPSIFLQLIISFHKDTNACTQFEKIHHSLSW